MVRSRRLPVACAWLTTIAAAAGLLLEVRPAAQAASWPNEPPGFAVIEETGWETGSLGNWYRIFTSADKPIAVKGITGSLIGETSGLQIDYAQGHVGGGGTELRYDIPSAQRPTEIYVGYYVQVNSAWQGHSSGINKMVYLHDGGSSFSAMWYEMFGSGGNALDLYVVNQSGSGPSGFHENVNQVTFVRGRWYRVEIYQKQGASNNGIVRVWVDGVLAIDRSDVDTRSTPIDNITISGIWGGVGDSKNQADFMRFDRIRISRPGSGTPPPDTTAPTVSLSAPAAGATVSGASVAVAAAASDNVGVAGVQFKLDGANLGAEDTTAPYAATWNTTTAANGPHTLTAVARDAAGNSTTSAAVSVTVANQAPPPPTGILFQERFENGNLSSRGWYDNTSVLLSTAERVAGSASSIEYRFLTGATTPTAGSALRRKFTPSDSVYLSYWVKYSANWVGSQRPYHPHEFHLLTNFDGDWSGLSFTHLTAYIEQNGGTPLIGIQDGANIDQARIGQNLTAITENRGVAGCNGSSDGYPDNCYQAGGSYVNEKKWAAASAYFTSTPGPRYKNDWHFVEAFIRLNSVAAGKGVNDGIVQYWFDGQPIIDRRNVLLRTGANAAMQFNQFVIAPYIGDGSPVTQSMWIDELTVAAAVPAPPADTIAPVVALTAPLAGATVAGSVAVSATATDNVGVAGVQFKLDGANLGAEDTTSPYSTSWNTAGAANGTHTLTAVARDAAGNQTTSSGITVTVANGPPPPDITPPAVSITAPLEGATVAGAAVTVSAAASDNVGVAGVQFQLDGASLGAEDTTAPYSVVWNSQSVPDGSHSLAAVARDAAGNRTLSVVVTVRVANTVAPPAPPTNLRIVR